MPASTLNAAAAAVVVTTLGSITNDHFSGLCDLSEYKHRQTGNMCVCWCSGGGGSCLQFSQSSVQLDCCYVLSPALSLHLFHSTAAVTWL